MSGEKLSPGTGGRVVEVNFHVGDEVKAGDVLIRLDTEKLDNDITRQKRKQEAIEEELIRLSKQIESSSEQYSATRARAEAEQAQAEREFRREQERQEANMREAAAELTAAEYEDAQLRRLSLAAAAPIERVKAAAQVRTAQEKLARARLPVDDGKVEVLRRTLVVVAKDHALRHQELEIKRGVKQGELAAARLELANLELARKQTVIRAHVDGMVTVGEVKVGDLLEPGKAVLAIVQQKGLRVDIAVPSRDVAHLHEGMRARVKLDAYDHQEFGAMTGTVFFISPDSEWSESQGRGYYIVRIMLDGDEVGCDARCGKAKIGMSGQVEIVSGRASILSLLWKKTRQAISLG